MTNKYQRTRQRRSGALRSLARLAPPELQRRIRQQGFLDGSVIRHWGSIVGPTYAAHCQPEVLRFPSGKRHGATLVILAESAFAPHLAHVEAQLLTAINRFFGYRAVSRISIRHGSPAPPLTQLERPRYPASSPAGVPQTVRNKALADALAGLAATFEEAQ